MSLSIVYDAATYVFSLDSSRPDAVVHQYSGSTISLPKTLTLRRVYPKRTTSYVGNARNHAKLTWNVTTADEPTPIIIDVSVSRRADVSSADVAIARGVLGNAILDTELDAFFSSLALPM